MGPEAKIQKAVVDYARVTYAEQLIVRKNQAGRFGTNGYPDYEFNAINGHTWFMEFKRLGGKLTPLQKRRIDELVKLGYMVYVCDNAGAGRLAVASEMKVAISGVLRRDRK